MPGAPGPMYPLTGTGILTFPTTSGGNRRFKYDLTQLASIATVAGKQPYLRMLHLAIDLSIKNTSGGSLTINWQKLYDVIKRVSLYMPGHQFLDFPTQGGQSIRYMNFVLSGKKPEQATDQVVGAGATVVVPIKFPIPFFDERSVYPAGRMPHLGFLKNSFLEIDWCDTSEFGANFQVQAATAPRLTAEIILRDQTVFLAPWTWQERVQNGLKDVIEPVKVLFTDVFMENVLAAGIAFTSQFSTSNLSQLNFYENGIPTYMGIQPQEIASAHNVHQAPSSEGYVALQESGNMDGLPLKYLPRSSGKETQLEPALNKPKLELTGNITTSNFILLLGFVKPNGAATVSELAARAEIQLPPDFTSNPDGPDKYLAPKSPSKQPVDTRKAAFLALKLYPNGTPAWRAGMLATQRKRAAAVAAARRAKA